MSITNANSVKKACKLINDLEQVWKTIKDVEEARKIVHEVKRAWEIVHEAETELEQIVKKHLEKKRIIPGLIKVDDFSYKFANYNNEGVFLTIEIYFNFDPTDGAEGTFSYNISCEKYGISRYKPTEMNDCTAQGVLEVHPENEPTAPDTHFYAFLREYAK